LDQVLYINVLIVQLDVLLVLELSLFVLHAHMVITYMELLVSLLVPTVTILIPVPFANPVQPSNIYLLIIPIDAHHAPPLPTVHPVSLTTPPPNSITS
jgi:hypothetical protein